MSTNGSTAPTSNSTNMSATLSTTTTTDPTFALLAVTPIDGRYAGTTAVLRQYVSEFGLFHARIRVEIEWLKLIATTPNFVPTLKTRVHDATLQYLDSIISNFTVSEALKVKEIEATTKHDVKAIEYYIKDQLKAYNTNTPSASPTVESELQQLNEFVHFAATSEDINNLSWALIVRQTVDTIILPSLRTVIDELRSLAHRHATVPMLSRTHGQAATPTTVGKEYAIFVYRLERQLKQIARVEYTSKFSGAVGNFNAHAVAYPQLDWIALSRQLIEQQLHLTYNPYTTQIESHDWNAELFDIFTRVNTILLDLSRDCWGYISLGFFKQKTAAGEVGSSTMPHKVNPIDFENAEGQLGLANALFTHLAQKLPISRWQRDLTDSTVQRSMGTAFAHTLIAYTSLLRGLKKLEINSQALEADLNSNWEVLAEPIQTVMRKFGVEQPYEKLKALTRGKRVDQQGMIQFVQSLKGQMPDDVIEQLLQLTPSTYVGLAAKLAKDV